MPKFPVKKGFHGFSDDSEEFLKPSSTNPRQTSASGVGYQGSRWDDDAGTRDLAGYGVDGADDSAEFLRASSGGIDYDAPHQKLSGLIDGQYDHSAGKLLGGGGPVSDNKVGGVGRGGPTHAPKNVGAAGQKNWDSRGGVSRGGRR